AAIGGSNSTRLWRAFRVSRPTIARPLGVNARPSGLPAWSPRCQVAVAVTAPPAAGRSESRAIDADLSLSRYRWPAGPIRRSLKSAQAFARTLSGDQTASGT